MTNLKLMGLIMDTIDNYGQVLQLIEDENVEGLEQDAMIFPALALGGVAGYV